MNGRPDAADADRGNWRGRRIDTGLMEGIFTACLSAAAKDIVA
jgi:hypothetical protein